ncbi:MAG: hypothetical protein KJI72_01220 [Patescibacteria group bacterium]|nr:hypothetical protein [Patescibacteria group bacterium]
MLIEIFSFAVLGGGFVVQLFLRRFGAGPSTQLPSTKLGAGRTSKAYRIFKYLFWISVAFIFTYYFYLVYAQYIAWRDGGSFTQLLVPPHQSIAYVFGYHFTRFGLYYLVSLAVALLLLVLASRLNIKFKRRFFEDEEPYLGALAVFILGNPAWGYVWIYYIITLLLMASLVTSYQLLITKENRRFSLYWLWLPVAILVIITKMA